MAPPRTLTVVGARPRCCRRLCRAASRLDTATGAERVPECASSAVTARAGASEPARRSRSRAPSGAERLAALLGASEHDAIAASSVAPFQTRKRSWRCRCDRRGEVRRRGRNAVPRLQERAIGARARRSHGAPSNRRVRVASILGEAGERPQPTNDIAAGQGLDAAERVGVDRRRWWNGMRESSARCLRCSSTASTSARDCVRRTRGGPPSLSKTVITPPGAC